jgi:hypothetical protein
MADGAAARHYLPHLPRMESRITKNGAVSALKQTDPPGEFTFVQR